ncbi:hypothetical protein VNI00_012956 [Paramarasmius palmivorus]|uniref:Enamelin n=1 Tax=Paramarasmius palmivorus TaxID=297713 RepID=A0AAW0BZW7_9AGAR
MFNNSGGFNMNGGAFNNVSGNQYNNSGDGPQHAGGTQHYGGTQNQYSDGNHYNNTGDGPQHVNSGHGTQNSHMIDSRSRVGPGQPAGWEFERPEMYHSPQSEPWAYMSSSQPGHRHYLNPALLQPRLDYYQHGRSRDFSHPYDAGWGISQPEGNHLQYIPGRDSRSPPTSDRHPYPPPRAPSEGDNHVHLRGAAPPAQRPAPRPTTHSAPGYVEEGYVHPDSRSSQDNYVPYGTPASQQPNQKNTHRAAPESGEDEDADGARDEGLGEPVRNPELHKFVRSDPK